MPKDGRDAKGRFLKGCVANPKGRPPGKAPYRRKYINALMEVLTLDKWTKVIDTAIKDAINGNGQARKWLGDYVLGLPERHVSITGTMSAGMAGLDAWKNKAFDVTVKKKDESYLKHLIEAGVIEIIEDEEEE